MNKKNKILLTSVGLAMLSGIAATSSTFAWFTTTRTAAISFSSATVESKQSNMVLGYVSGNVTNSAGSTANNLLLTGGNKVTDISGDGIKFFKPVWAATEGLATKINAIPYTLPADATNYWVEFTVSVKVDGLTPMNIYLGTGTKITAVVDAVNQAKNDKAVLGSRMAVIVGAATSAKVIYAPDAPVGGHTYLDAASTDPVDVYSVTGAPEASKDNIATVAAGFTTLTANALGDAGFLTAIAAGVTTNLTFRVWLEGEDPDTINLAIGGIFDIAVDLYALEV